MSSTAIITFGRFNPITIGHEKLVSKVKRYAKLYKAEPLVFLSHSYDNKKNPLAYADKYFYARKAFGDCVQFSDARTIIDVMKRLDCMYDEVKVVVGEDRVTGFEDLLQKYNGIEYNFSDIEILSAGLRDPDAEGIEGMSASKLRSYAINNYVDEFENGLPIDLRPYSQTILQLVRKGLNYAN